jgi:hypothetical protein
VLFNASVPTNRTDDDIFADGSSTPTASMPAARARNRARGMLIDWVQMIASVIPARPAAWSIVSRVREPCSSVEMAAAGMPLPSSQARITVTSGSSGASFPDTKIDCTRPAA